ncbi:unnamed protein product [Protopolystoma xenopodis]|uniref:Uncharacterized protein n=1 Tax=Protopolystoma xenopodis TaxID=117903 RepID=A0A448WW50_9PLAT|nr:unnamed protein product [Protopolystoma xenopodis]
MSSSLSTCSAVPRLPTGHGTEATSKTFTFGSSRPASYTLKSRRGGVLPNHSSKLRLNNLVPLGGLKRGLD